MSASTKVSVITIKYVGMRKDHTFVLMIKVFVSPTLNAQTAKCENSNANRLQSMRGPLTQRGTRPKFSLSLGHDMRVSSHSTAFPDEFSFLFMCIL